MPERSRIDPNYSSDNLEKIHSLRDFLISEVSISDPKEGIIEIKINIRNGASKSPDGGEIVFLGVGLRIIDNSESSINRDGEYWHERIRISRVLYYADLHRQYKEGIYFGTGVCESTLLDLTPDENSHGAVLFPEEIIEYLIKIEEADLPYLDIKVEGSVSQQHLLHISRPIYELKKCNQTLLNQTFQAIDKIDFSAPLVSIVKDIPILGAKTKIADINKVKTFVEKGIIQIDELRAKLDEVYQTTQHKIMRDYMEKVIGNYLNSVAEAFETTREALSSGDTGNIKQATHEMVRKVLVETEEIKLQRANLISQFDFDVEMKSGLLRRFLPMS